MIKIKHIEGTPFHSLRYHPSEPDKTIVKRTLNFYKVKVDFLPDAV